MTRRSAFDQSQAKTAEPRDRSPRTIEFLRADLPFPFLLIPLRGSAVGNDPRRGRTPHPTGEQGSRRPSSREDLRGFYCIDLSLYPRPLSSQITADESGPQRCFSTAFHPLHHCLKRGGMPAYSSRIFLSGVHSRFLLLPVFTVSHSTVVVLVETRRPPRGSTRPGQADPERFRDSLVPTADLITRFASKPVRQYSVVRRLVFLPSRSRTNFSAGRSSV